MNQHLVSRALLRRFADAKGGPVGFLDLETLDTDEDAVEKLGSVEDLLTAQADELEQKWSRQVENRLTALFQVIDAQQPLTAPGIKVTIQRLIALHWARGFAMHQIFEKLGAHHADDVATQIIAEVGPTAVLRNFTGVEVVGPSAYGLAHERLRQEFHRKVEDDGFLSSQLEHHYDEALKRLQDFEFELWYTKSDEFILGDCPTVTWDRQGDRVGVLKGAAWEQADHLFMVVGPHHAIAPACKVHVGEAPARLVEQVNVLQVRGAYKHVFYRPGSGLGDFLAEVIRANEALGKPEQ